MNVISPFKISDMVESLQHHVVGQDAAIKDIVLAIYKYKIRVMHSLATIHDGLIFSPTLTSPETLFINGHTGCGKTYIIQQAAELFELPIISINSINIGPGGSWHGKSLAEMIESQLDSTAAIVLIDEADKLCNNQTTSKGEKWNAFIQQSILKLIEGDEILKINKNGLKAEIKSSSLLYAFAGSFSSLDEELSMTKNQIGYTGESTKTDLSDMDMATRTSTLIKHGLIPELAGRIKKMIRINSLTKEDFEQIILNEELNNSLSFYNKFLESNGKKELKRNSLLPLAEDAVKLKLGVRGLYTLIESEIDKRLMEEDILIDSHIQTVF